MKGSIIKIIYDLAVNKDYLFVLDYNNNNLIIFGLSDGNIISTFDVSMPHGVAIDQQIYLFDNLLNDLGSFYVGDYLPTNLAILYNRFLIFEEKANCILYINLANLNNILN